MPNEPAAPVDALVTQEDLAFRNEICLEVARFIKDSGEGMIVAGRLNRYLDQALACHRTTAERRGYQAATEDVEAVAQYLFENQPKTARHAVGYGGWAGIGGAVKQAWRDYAKAALAIRGVDHVE